MKRQMIFGLSTASGRYTCRGVSKEYNVILGETLGDPVRLLNEDVFK